MAAEPSREELMTKLQELEARIVGERALELDRLSLLSQAAIAERLGGYALMASRLAHNFNNLLQGVIGNTSLARQAVDDESPTGKQLQKIERSARKAVGLSQELLELATGGRRSPVSFDPRVLVERAAAGRPFPVSVRLEGELPTVEGDLAQLVRALGHLIENAAEAGSDRIEFIASRLVLEGSASEGALLDDHLPPGEYLCLCISDHALGLDDVTRDHAFDPFFTSHADHRGLGLPLVLGIIRGHGGAIRFKSRVGGGTACELLLPSVGTRAKQPFRLVRSPDERAVLLCEPDPAERLVAAAALKVAAVPVLAVADAEAALMLAEQRRSRLAAVWLGASDPACVESFLPALARCPAGTPVVLGGPSACLALLTNQEIVGRVDRPYAPAELLPVARRLFAIARN